MRWEVWVHGSWIYTDKISTARTGVTENLTKMEEDLNDYLQSEVLALLTKRSTFDASAKERSCFGASDGKSDSFVLVGAYAETYSAMNFKSTTTAKKKCERKDWRSKQCSLQYTEVIYPIGVVDKTFGCICIQ